MVNEDANAKLIRELKEEILKLRELLKAEGIEVAEGTPYVISDVVVHYMVSLKTFDCDFWRKIATLGFLFLTMNTGQYRNGKWT